MNIRNAIFDLDGTLVDTRSGIEFSYRAALQSVLPDRVVPSGEFRLGPPIREIFSQSLGIADVNTLNHLEQHFRESYDSIGWRKSTAYPGAAESLGKLREAGVRLFVATNKPQWSSCEILKELRLYDFFEDVLSPDSQTPRFDSKGQIVAHVLRQYGLRANETAMVGDSNDDRMAALENNVAFVAANYGYGRFDFEAACMRRIAVAPRLMDIFEVLSDVA